MPKKTKQAQPKTKDVQIRDLFQTPRYAVELLIPFIPKNAIIWEPAAGELRISRILQSLGYKVVSSDIQEPTKHRQQIDFLNSTKSFVEDNKIDTIITNPPFSLKFDFITKALELDVKNFGFLIPFDMCGFLHRAFNKFNLNGIVPERRIDYFTPYIITRISDGEALSSVNKMFKSKFKTYEELLSYDNDGYMIQYYHENKKTYSSIEKIPYQIFKKYTSSDFHSFWVGKFETEKQFEFVPLTLEQKKRII